MSFKNHLWGSLLVLAVITFLGVGQLALITQTEPLATYYSIFLIAWIAASAVHCMYLGWRYRTDRRTLRERFHHWWLLRSFKAARFGPTTKAATRCFVSFASRA